MTDHDIWILAEQQDGRILRISHELLTRGLGLKAQRGGRLCAMVFGHGLAEEDLADLVARGADRVLAVEAPELAHFLVEPHARCLRAAIDEFRPEIILAGATSTGRTLLPYVAMTAHCGLTADCTGLDIEEGTGHLLQTRPAIGGNIMATIKTPDHRPQMATIRPRSTPPAPPQPGRTGEIIRRDASADLLASRIVRTGFTPDEEEHGLQEADAVVCVGRGIKRAENLALARALAEVLGAALGATRDVVDRGWLSYPHQVGLSGKTISPKLYIGIGVSGSIQHLAGIQTAETIVAINQDPEAQLFKVADVGLVGDLFAIVPALTAAVRAGQQPFAEPGAKRRA
jgi:electron transfer flavoprotein alpha subunit